LNGADFQIIYSDTPGVMEPKYELHKAMMRFVYSSLEDADVVLFVTDIFEKDEETDIIKKLKSLTVPVYILVNKIDLAEQERVVETCNYWREKFPTAKEVIPISALEKFNLEKIFSLILENLPAHPPYYSKDELTDKPERFFAAEIVREKIFLNYKQEIPYSTLAVIDEFKETDAIIKVRAIIYVERDSQKGIIIGNKGAALKKVGTQAREEMEKFFNKKVFLETHVKVEPDWRNNSKKLEKFGFSD
jgi:GTP-binding protein Era